MQAIKNADGRLEVFVRGSDGALNHIWQTAPNSGWSDWETLGIPHPDFRSQDGQFSYGTLTTTPSVNLSADGRLEVFAVGRRDIYHADLVHIWQPAPNSGPWSNWSSLGGQLKFVAPATARNADGRLEVFACTSDNALWHIWQTAPSNGWSGWQSLGGQVVGAPIAIENADGRIEVFVRGTDAQLWHIWQTAPNGNWSGWASLGGYMLSTPVAVRNADGKLEVFATSYLNGWPLAHIWQISPNGPWSGWAADLPVDQPYETPAVALNADSRLEVFGNGWWLGPLRHQWQTWPDRAWSVWNTASDGYLGGINTSAPVVAQNADGRIEVFCRGSDFQLYHIWQTAPNNGWSEWDGLGDWTFSDLGRTTLEISGFVWGNS
jgi:hypothetical protein